MAKLPLDPTRDHCIYTDNETGGLYCITCGLEFTDWETAREHTTLVDNTPNATRLLEALRAGRGGRND